MQILRAGALVVGTGCAGYNAADWLCAYGVPDVCLVTEGREAGTSRNAGSDKQTYYKLSLASGAADSPPARWRATCSRAAACTAIPRCARRRDRRARS